MTADYEWPAEDECLWCREPFQRGDILAADPVLTPAGQRHQHRECAVRSVVGGINHQNGKCTCCGGTLPPDPEGVSKRQAAKMAYQMYVARREWQK